MFFRRGCCCGVIGLLGLCVVAGALGYFVALPQLRQTMRKPLEEAVGTQIARNLQPASGDQPAPGTYVISEDDLNTAIRSQLGQTGVVDDAAITLAPTGFALRAHFTNGGGDVTYRGNVAAVDGRLQATNLTGDGMMTTLFPPAEVGKTLENAVNDYLDTNGLLLTKAKLGNGTLTLTTAGNR
jgi:hypothetical protein